MENVKAYSKQLTALRQKKYVVRPIRRKGGWVPPDHDSAFMNEGSKMGIVVPVKAGNVLVDPFVFGPKPTDRFTDEDVKLLASELGLADEKYLNIQLNILISWSPQACGGGSSRSCRKETGRRQAWPAA